MYQIKLYLYKCFQARHLQRWIDWKFPKQLLYFRICFCRKISNVKTIRKLANIQIVDKQCSQFLPALSSLRNIQTYSATWFFLTIPVTDACVERLCSKLKLNKCHLSSTILVGIDQGGLSGVAKIFIENVSLCCLKIGNQISIEVGYLVTFIPLYNKV